MKEQIKKKFEWVKEHKTELLMGSATAIGSVVLIVLGCRVKTMSETYSKNDIFNLGENLKLKGHDRLIRDIDEDIFTDLAIKMEGAIIDEDLDKVVIEKAYDLGDNLSKLVTVSIRNVYGD